MSTNSLYSAFIGSLALAKFQIFHGECLKIQCHSKASPVIKADPVYTSHGPAASAGVWLRATDLESRAALAIGNCLENDSA